METRTIIVENNEGQQYKINRDMFCADSMTHRGKNTFNAFRLKDRPNNFIKQQYVKYCFIVEKLGGTIDEEGYVRGQKGCHTFILFRLFRYYRNDKLELIIDCIYDLIKNYKVKPYVALVMSHHIYKDKLFIECPLNIVKSEYKYSYGRDIIPFKKVYLPSKNKYINGEVIEFFIPPHNISKFLQSIKDIDINRGNYYKIFRFFISEDIYTDKLNSNQKNIVKISDRLYNSRIKKYQGYLKNKEYKRAEKFLLRLSKIYS